MSPQWAHTGAVLAGGSSTRMGFAKEDLILPTGRSMIETVISVLATVCDRVVVVGGKATNLDSVDDLRPGTGPLGGIEALLSSGIDDQYLVCPSDIPLITTGLLLRLTAPTTADATIFDVAGETRLQTLPVRLSTTALETVSAALGAGRNALHSVFDRLDVDRVPITVDEATALFNVNTPDECAELDSS